jgi:bifunctional non-homologous end joining protein LigD
VLVDGHEVRLTSLDRVFYPETGFTKGQALDYYARIAEVLLPHLRGRPMTLKRYPNGVAGPHFYDKHCTGAPPWVEVAPVWSERRGEAIRFCRLEDTASVLWSVNRGNLEMHPLLSAAPDFETPTVLVLDLDPGAPAGPLEAGAVALLAREMLRGVGLESWVKASGGSGVQVYAPLNSPVTYAQTKALARRVAEVLAARLPDRVVARADKRARRGRVFVDWGQNDRHKSTVAPYSLRAKHPFPTVSAPLGWDELERAVAAGDAGALLVSPDESLARVEADGDRFAPVLSLVQRL